MSAGRVGRAHGRDGSFYVEDADHPLPHDTAVVLAGERRRVVRRAGGERRPLVRLSGIDDREAVDAVRRQPLLVEDGLAEGEWLARDLVGLEVEGMGRVQRVLAGPSCDLLELEDGELVPFVSDAIRSVGAAISVDARFLGL